LALAKFVRNEVVNMNYYNQNLNTSDWKKINIEYLNDYISLKVPPTCETLQLEPTPALAETKKEIENAFENPVNSGTIDEIIANQSKPTGEITVAIVQFLIILRMMVVFFHQYYLDWREQG